MKDSKIKISHLAEFDMAEHLPDAQAVAEYLTMVIADGDAAELARALGIAARARGMTEVAREAGVSREALYRALRAGAEPRFDTINRVCAALGVRLVAQVATDPSRAEVA
jgi:probable addiction module antidote protein